MLLGEQETNNDGSGVYCFNEKNNVIYNKRKMTEDAKSICQNLLKFDIVNYHFRNSTIGSVKEDNVHFWKIGDWVFAHNGTISELKEEDKADSLVFFERLVKKGFLRKNGYINLKKIKTFTNSTTFWGRFIIINTISKKMYFFGDFQTYLLNRSSLVITSSTASFDSYVNIKGINFEIKDDLEILETELEGINTYSFKDGFKNVDEKFKEYKQYNDKAYGDYGYDYTKKNDKEEIAKEELEVNNYFSSIEYQEETERIENRFEIASKKFQDSAKTSEDIKEYEQAEIKRDCDIDFTEELFYGSKQTKLVPA